MCSIRRGRIGWRGPMRTSVAEAGAVPDAGGAPGFDVAPGVGAALRNFKLPDKLGFGLVAAPVMFSARWADGAWGRGELVAYGPIEILPGARALQYAELVFEGLKAYKVGETSPSLFRPRENWQRLKRSAERLSMPAVPEARTAVMPPLRPKVTRVNES